MSQLNIVDKLFHFPHHDGGRIVPMMLAGRLSDFSWSFLLVPLLDHPWNGTMNSSRAIRPACQNIRKLAASSHEDAEVRSFYTNMVTNLNCTAIFHLTLSPPCFQDDEHRCSPLSVLSKGLHDTSPYLVGSEEPSIDFLCSSALSSSERTES